MMSFAQVGLAAEDVSSIAKGGKLYDKWFAVTAAPKPQDNHPASPTKTCRPCEHSTCRFHWIFWFTCNP